MIWQYTACVWIPSLPFHTFPDPNWTITKCQGRQNRKKILQRTFYFEYSKNFFNLNVAPLPICKRWNSVFLLHGTTTVDCISFYHSTTTALDAFSYFRPKTKTATLLFNKNSFLWVIYAIPLKQDHENIIIMLWSRGCGERERRKTSRTYSIAKCNSRKWQWQWNGWCGCW